MYAAFGGMPPGDAVPVMEAAWEKGSGPVAVMYVPVTPL